MKVTTAFFAIAIFCLASVAAHGGDITWVGGTGYDWNTEQNWSPEGLPGTSSDVIFNPGYGPLQFDANTGTATVNTFQNSGSSSANFYVSGTDGNAALTITNGMTGGSGLTTQITSGGSGTATLNLGGASTLAGPVSVGGQSTLNLLSNATATLSSLNVSGSSEYQATVTIASGASLTTNSLYLGSSSNEPTGFLNLNGGMASATQGFTINGQAVLNSSASLSLTGTANLGQFYDGGPTQTGGYLDNGGYIAAGSGPGTLNLGSDLQMSGSTDGTITAGYEANSNLTINNTASGTITLNSGTIGSPDNINQVILTGNMNFVGTTLSGGAGGVVLQGANSFLYSGTTWSGYITLADGSSTTVQAGITQGSQALTVNLLGDAQLIIQGSGLPGGTASIQGIYNIAPNASLTLDDAYLDGAVVNTSGTFYVPNGYSQTSGTESVDGNLNAGTSSVSFLGGTLEGSGTVTGSQVDIGDATIKGGDSPGTLTLDSNLVESDDSTTLFQAGGSDPGTQYDVIDVNGNVTLDGMLNTELLDLGSGTFVPDVGELFDILNYTGTLTGEFTSLDDYIGPDEKWVLSYATSGCAEGYSGCVELEAETGTPLSPPPPASTPEPQTLLLLAAGLAIIAAAKRRSHA